MANFLHKDIVPQFQSIMGRRAKYFTVSERRASKLAADQTDRHILFALFCTHFSSTTNYLELEHGAKSTDMQSIGVVMDDSARNPQVLNPRHLQLEPLPPLS
jgi:hypothetical protein